MIEAGDDFVLAGNLLALTAGPPPPPPPPRPPSSSSAPKRRKFPGPAGNLTRIATSKGFLYRQISPDEETANRIAAARASGGLNFGDEFPASDAWSRMLEDKNMDENDPEAAVNRYSVAWVKRKTIPGTTKRAPILICLLQQIDLDDPDARCILQDRSGKVEATFHRDVVEAYADYMRPGTVLELKDVRVLMSARTHCVIVTKDNVVALYRTRDDGGADRERDRLANKEDLKDVLGPPSTDTLDEDPLDGLDEDLLFGDF
jgi:hypothetical protein